PFTSILFHGFVLDAHGIKMSKSKGNVVGPEEVAKKYGTDVLRFYLLSSPPWEDFYFKWVDVEAVAKSFTVIENTFNFVKMYGGEGSGKEMLPEDRWIMSRLNSMAESYIENMKSYDIHKAAQELHNFIVDDFSRWYIKIVRNRVWPSYSGRDKGGALFALREVSEKVLAMLAPFCPFLSEKINLELGGGESIHLRILPEGGAQDKELEDGMKTIKDIVEACNSIRKENGIKIKWPVRSISVETESKGVKKAVEVFGKVLLDMANAGEIKKTSGHKKEFPLGVVHMSREIMKDEALFRELLRAVQDKRKKEGMKVTDRIILYIDGDMKKFEKEIMEKVSAEKIVFKKLREGESVELEDMKLKFLVESA
ncbi:MAG: class I tRNA ligase family protein, partial [Candidatus Aenigmarchaeota archaeon]|nr:class I tRNA ligase family protein [Candidatus Aenigmarchaeota archaeon]